MHAAFVHIYRMPPVRSGTVSWKQLPVGGGKGGGGRVKLKGGPERSGDMFLTKSLPGA